MPTFSDLETRILQDIDFQSRFTTHPSTVLREAGIQLSEKKAEALTHLVNQLNALSSADGLGESLVHIVGLLKPDHLDGGTNPSLPPDDFFGGRKESLLNLIGKLCNLVDIPDKPEPIFAIEISPEDLKVGDIFLSFGKKACVSKLIRYLDGGFYSHAGIFDGEKSIDMHETGLEPMSVERLAELQDYVHVYRFISDSGEMLGQKGWPSDPILDVINHYRDPENGYNYDIPQLFLLALWILVKRAPNHKGILAKIEEWIREAIEQLMASYHTGNRGGLVCTSLVYRCFEEADTDNKYHIHLDDVPTPLIGYGETFLSSLEEVDLQDMNSEQLMDTLKGVYMSVQAESKQSSSGSGGGLTIDYSIADFVTPVDIEKSRNTTLLGKLVI